MVRVMVEDDLGEVGRGGEGSPQGSPGVPSAPAYRNRGRASRKIPPEEVGVPVAPSKRMRRLTRDQLEVACKLRARGVDTATIAAVLLEPTRRVDRDLRSRVAQNLIRAVRGKSMLLEL